MDDIVLFSNDLTTITSDFYLIQELLGQKGLSVNPSKTTSLTVSNSNISDQVDSVKRGLLRKRRRVMERLYSQDEASNEPEEEAEMRSLSSKELAFLQSLLREPHIEEEDSEMVLSLMGSHSADVLSRFGDMLEQFPNLSKTLYIFCGNFYRKEELAEIIHEFLLKTTLIPEFQLFYIGMIAEDHLTKTRHIAEILRILYEHSYATPITKAKILEIPDGHHGLPDLRRQHIMEGKSDWLAWAAAVGCRDESKGERNHVLKYYRNASPLNSIIAELVSSYDPSP